MRIRGFLAKVRLVRKQMLDEDGRSSRGPVLRTASENMVSGATEHTTAKTQRVAGLKVGEWVSREAIGLKRRRGSVTWYGWLHGGHERMIKGRDIIRMTRGNGMSSRDKTSIINGRSKGVDGRSNRERISQEGRRKVFQLPVNGASNQFILGFLSVVMTNCSKPELMKSIELLSTISKTHKIRCDVPMVDAQYFLQFRRKGIMVLADEIQTPEGHIRRK